MKNPDSEIVEALSLLSKIDLTKAEKEAMGGDFQKIIALFDLLTAVDTEDTAPTYHVASELTNLWREDEETDLTVQEEELIDRSFFLQQAPQHMASLVRVPSFMVGGET